MLWTHKYKPNKISDICGNTEVLLKLKEGISKTNNVIVYGPHGLGKTLAISCILNELQAKDENVYKINACSDRGIKLIRNGLVSFLKIKTDGKKYVIIEDIINMNVGSQYGLCSIMEKYTEVCFIFCTNNYQYVIESIQSRCYFFPFHKIEKEELKSYAIKILEKESKKYEDEIFDILYDFTKGDMRKYMINLQSASHKKHSDLLLESSTPDFISKENLLCVIKKPFFNTMEKIIEHTIKNDRKTCMNEINFLLSQGYNHGDIIKYLFDFCIDYELEKNIKLKYLDFIGKAQITNARGLYSNIQLDYLMVQLCNLSV